MNVRQVEDTPFGHLLVNYGSEDQFTELDPLTQVSQQLQQPNPPTLGFVNPHKPASELSPMGDGPCVWHNVPGTVHVSCTCPAALGVFKEVL